MLITTYKETNQLQSSCISLPTATVPVVTPHMYIVWQTNYELVMCISRVSHVFAIPRAHTKIACNSACTRQFLKLYMH